MKTLGKLIAPIALTLTSTAAMAGEKHHVPTQSEAAEKKVGEDINNVIGELSKACPGGYEMTTRFKTEPFNEVGEMTHEFSLLQCGLPTENKEDSYREAFKRAAEVAKFATKSALYHLNCTEGRMITITDKATGLSTDVSTGDCGPDDNPALAQAIQSHHTPDLFCPANPQSKGIETEKRITNFIAGTIS